PLFLFRRTIAHQRRTQQKNTVLIDSQRRASTVILFLEDQPVDKIQATAAKLLRPGHRTPAAGVEGMLPLTVRSKPLLGIKTRQRAGRHGGHHPVPYFLAEGVLMLRVFQFHLSNSASRFSTK